MPPTGGAGGKRDRTRSGQDGGGLADLPRGPACRDGGCDACPRRAGRPARRAGASGWRAGACPQGAGGSPRGVGAHRRASGACPGWVGCMSGIPRVNVRRGSGLTFERFYGQESPPDPPEGGGFKALLILGRPARPGGPVGSRTGGAGRRHCGTAGLRPALRLVPERFGRTRGAACPARQRQDAAGNGR